MRNESTRNKSFYRDSQKGIEILRGKLNKSSKEVWTSEKSPSHDDWNNSTLSVHGIKLLVSFLFWRTLTRSSQYEMRPETPIFFSSLAHGIHQIHFLSSTAEEISERRKYLPLRIRKCRTKTLCMTYIIFSPDPF